VKVTHVEHPEQKPVSAESPAQPLAHSGTPPQRIQAGSGYGGEPYQKGQILKDRSGQIVVVTRAWQRSFRGDESAMSFGAGEEDGTVYYAEIRPATDEEQGQFGKEAKQRQARRLIRQAEREEDLAAGALHYDADGWIGPEEQRRRHDEGMEKARQMRQQAAELSREESTKAVPPKQEGYFGTELAIEGDEIGGYHGTETAIEPNAKKD